MTRRYDDGEFIKNEPERRKLRDQYRDKFFAGLGATRLSDPFEFEPNSVVQFEAVSRLIAKSLPSLEANSDALELAHKEIQSLVMGVNVDGFGPAPGKRINFQRMSTRSLDQNFFSTKLSGL
ncbi:hypothetical protein [Rhizobium halophytocola]|uniref:Uncharacterized protein n=1 Tax=Rhizobium halophytocola TaxID=735519 RepID=A0ABS4E693_9HYPH|nr:hypothetical protein [Rhizobium halophytocola]MBP1853438.1 hypothetical protein [Rhizobium halophytocola]